MYGKQQRRKSNQRRVRLKSVKYAFSTTSVVVRYYQHGKTFEYLCAIGSGIPAAYDDFFVESISTEKKEVLGDKIDIIVIQTSLE